MQFDLDRIHVFPREMFILGIPLPGASQMSPFCASATFRRRPQTSLRKLPDEFVPSSDPHNGQAEPHRAIEDGKSPRNQSAAQTN